MRFLDFHAIFVLCCLLAAGLCSTFTTDFTNIYITDSYKDVIEFDKYASFGIYSEALASGTLVKSVRNNSIRNSIVLILNHRFFNDLSYSIEQRISHLQESFLEITLMPLKFVITDAPGHHEYKSAFDAQNIHIINNYTNILSCEESLSSLNGINLINFQGLSRKSIKQLKKITGKNSSKLTKFAEKYKNSLFNDIAFRISRSVPSSTYSAPVASRYSAPVASSSSAPVASSYSAPVASSYSAPVASSYSAPVASSSSAPVASSYSAPVASRYTPRSIDSDTLRNPSSNQISSSDSSLPYSNNLLQSTRRISTASSTVPRPRERLFFEARPQGAFTLIFTGIKYFYLAKVFGFSTNSAFMIFYEDFQNNMSMIEKALSENVKLIIATDDVFVATADPSTARHQKTLVSVHIDGWGRPDLFTPIRGITPNIRQAFSSLCYSEIRISSEFDPSNDSLIFRDFMKVDLTAGSAMNTLRELVSRMNQLNIESQNFTACVDLETPVSLAPMETETLKIERFRRAFINRYGNSREFTLDRQNVFLDSVHQMSYISNPDFLNLRFYIRYLGGNGIDAGGLTRDFFSQLAKQMFNPDYALFKSSEINQNSFLPNFNSNSFPESIHYFRFIGRIIAKALIENFQLDCQFVKAFYKIILSKNPSYLDMEEIDADLYSSHLWILENDITGILDHMTFSVDYEVFGEKRTVELIPNGANIYISEENKFEYVYLRSKYAFEDSIRPQLDAFLEGFYGIIPLENISFFTVDQFKKLIYGSPVIDVEDWRTFTEYTGYTDSSIQVTWFWRAIESFSQDERRAILHFVTGSPNVPLEGFAYLRSSGNITHFKINQYYGSSTYLPIAHTCFNTIDLPVYPSYEILLAKLRAVISNFNEGFSFS